MKTLTTIYRIILLFSFSMITYAATESTMQRPADPLEKAMKTSYEERVVPMTAEKKMIKAYFEQKVFPLVPQAIKNLQANPICPGACCPDEKVTGFNQPDKHAAIIAYKLMGKRLCTLPHN